MLLAGPFHQRWTRIVLLLVLIFFMSSTVIYSLFGSDVLDNVPDLKSKISSLSTSPSPPEDLPLALPEEYGVGPPRGHVCADRFTAHYLEDLRDHAVGYCAPGVKGNLTCFHTWNRSDGKSDSMCFGRGVDFDAATGKFRMDCSIRDLSKAETDGGLVPFHRIQGYWYETGPPEVFKAALDIHDPATPAEEQAALQETIEERQEAKTEDESTDVASTVVPEAPPRNLLLLKREGEGNIWHCMMEIFSTWMTFDVLRIAQDPSNSSQPFFRVPEDVQDTQVVILDERKDGPYFDLWTLFAGRKPMRLKELAGKPELAAQIKDANIIVPLAGSSNPLWQDDWEAGDCASTPAVSVFSQRVVDFYGIAEPAPRKADSPIKVTFIDRTSSRRLLNQTAMFDGLRERNKHIALDVIDFADISFTEQLRVVRDTDVLVGVHGAGLTHALFMREFKGVMVEIQPNEMNFHVFRNIALVRGLGYYRIHGKSVQSKSRSLNKRGDWHFMDVEIDPDRFVDVVDTAVKSLYGNGAWDYDIN